MLAGRDLRWDLELEGARVHIGTGALTVLGLETRQPRRPYCRTSLTWPAWWTLWITSIFTWCRFTPPIWTRMWWASTPTMPVWPTQRRKPANAMDVALKQKSVELSRSRYGSPKDTPFTEKLVTGQGIRISRQAVRKIPREAGILPKRRRRPPRHRSRRAYRPQKRMMVLWDGSAHRLLQVPRGPLMPRHG